MKQNWEPDVKRGIAELWRIAVELLGEDRARELFVHVTKRRRGQRGPGRNLGSPSKAAKRMRLSYILKGAEGGTRRIVRELTEEDLEDLRRYEEEITDWLHGPKKK
jgi:hypothetical protein